MTAGGGRLDARAVGIAVFAMAILGGSYTVGKVALQALGALAVAAGILIVTAER